MRLKKIRSKLAKWLYVLAIKVDSNVSTNDNLHTILSDIVRKGPLIEGGLVRIPILKLIIDREGNLYIDEPTGLKELKLLKKGKGKLTIFESIWNRF